VVLAVLLLTAAVAGKRRLPLGLYGLCFLAVVGLGYFGGELVYGKPAFLGQKVESSDELVRRGAELFSKDCAACHYTDSKETKIGPGLKGILSGETLPVSGRPATEENVRHQLKDPYKAMPSYSHLEEEKVRALIAYLQSL
jgi:mono/diheme cytochrome c family protein